MKTLLCSILLSSVCAFAGVSVSAPANGASTSSPVHFVATASTGCSRGVGGMGIYSASGVLAYTAPGSRLNTYLPLSAGTHHAVVQEWDRCGGSTFRHITIRVFGGSPPSTVPPSRHVVVVLEENHSYSSVIGNPQMPYFNSLASTYALATQYYANAHPSIGNYFMLTAGQLITGNDGYCGTFGQDNIVRHLLTGGKTWKAYVESLPYTGYTGCDVYPYAKHHNPLAYFTDVAWSSQKYNLVPFTQFGNDRVNNALPEFSFVVPNLLHDAHDGTLSAADAWMKANIAPLISNAAFQSDGILIILFDESFSSDVQHGGGHVAAVVVGPRVKRGYRSAVFYQHQSTLKTVMQALGLPNFPGVAPGATPMNDMF
ncbi:MAG: hypothetical protein JOZ14_00515 [Acidobacteria bacterium]|nr:hypothetical protein [Acidobacteriota bacterium]